MTGVRTTSRGFSLMELLVVMMILAILAAITLPAVKSLTKSNDQSQATNLVRSMIGTARSIAISQHRMAGVVFFEETGGYSRPANSGQTAMQLFVESYDQTGVLAGLTGFVYYSSARQYLPAGVKLAVLSDTGSGIIAGENTTAGQATRAILFDANGDLVMQGGLATPDPGPTPSANPGRYPEAYGDWKFQKPNVARTLGNGDAGFAASSPGFFLYSKTDYDAAGLAAPGADANRAAWLRTHADVIVVNANTGNIIR